MIKRVARDEAERMPLPGRVWHTYLGPQNTPTERVSIGVSIFPPGSRPEGHVHDIAEETIYCAGGRGRIVTPDAVAEIEAGVTVWVSARHPPRHRVGRAGPARARLLLLAAGRGGLIRAEGRRVSAVGAHGTFAGEIAAPAVLDAAELGRLREAARRIRVEIVRTVDHAKGGHLGGPLSAADILAALYFRVLRIRPDEPAWPDRDRFILSKGHSSVGLYAAMALRGYFPVEELATFDAVGSRLQGHPDMLRLPGLDMSTGSLGMGISAGVGIALGAPAVGPRRPDLRAPRRRRVPGGRSLGGGDGRRPVRPGQPRRDRGPQQAAAVRVGRGGGARAGRPPARGPGRAGRQVVRVRLARPGGRRPRHGGGRRDARRGGRAGRTSGRDRRPHDEGQGRLLHGGPLLLAHAAASRRTSSRRRCASSARRRPARREVRDDAADGARPARDLRRDRDGARADGSADRPPRRRPRQLHARATSSRRRTPIATSRWGSRSRTCSASRPGSRRWGSSRTSAPSCRSPSCGRSTRSACSSRRRTRT